jgi:iron complex outermembrane receptor protein
MFIEAEGGVPCVGGAVPPACQYVIANGRRVTVTTGSAQPIYARRTVGGAALTLDWSIGKNFDLKSITGWRTLSWNQALDSDTSSINFVGTNPVHLVDHQISEELDLSGTIGPLDGVAGVYYFDALPSETNRVAFNQGFPGAMFPQNAPFVLFYNTHPESISKAAFVDATYHVTPQLRLDAGLRYTEDKKTDTQQNYYEFSGLAALYPLGLYPYPNGTVDACGGTQTNPNGTTTDRTTQQWDKLTWKGGVEFDTSKSSMIYAVVTSGYKSGGFDDFTTCGLTFKPETVTNYEVGTKARFFGNLLSIRLDAYLMKYKDMQLQTNTLAGEVTTNAGKATIPGSELEFQLQATDQLRFDGFLNYMDGHFDSYLNTYPLGTGIVEQFGGTPLPNNPRWSGLLGVNYVLQLGSGSVTARAEGSFTTHYRFNPYTPKDAALYRAGYDEQSGYGIGNLFLTYATSGGRWRIQAFVRNVSDKYYRTSALDLASIYGHVGFPNMPRSFGLEVNTKLK